jgi:hypothetical protein
MKLEEALKKVLHGWASVRGGNGRAPSSAELIFAKKHPTLERGKYFGTGPGGEKRWGHSYFTADFYNKKRKLAYEINGTVHRHDERKERDKRKSAFFKTLGITIKTIDREKIDPERPTKQQLIDMKKKKK